VFIAYMELRNLSPENFAALETLRRRYENELEAILRAAAVRPRAAWRVPDTKLAAMALIAMLTGVNTWFREGGRLSRERVEDIYVDMVRKAVPFACRPATGMGATPFSKSRSAPQVAVFLPVRTSDMSHALSSALSPKGFGAGIAAFERLDGGHGVMLLQVMPKCHAYGNDCRELPMSRIIAEDRRAGAEKRSVLKSTRARARVKARQDAAGRRTSAGSAGC
jgi:hypothetical protein